MKCKPQDAKLLTLLDLNGLTFWRGKYWFKFEAYKVDRNKHRPHGIKYSLTMHDRNNTRLLGFDNAHAIKKRGRQPKKYTGRVVTWDHVHKQEKVERYLFSTASQLLDDFWNAVDGILSE